MPSLIVDRINKDITIVKRSLEKGIRDSVSPVTGQPFEPISDTTKRVRALRRTNRKSKTKPLLATGKMSKLKRVNASSTKFKGTLTMGKSYGVYHLSPRTIQTNFGIKGRKRSVKLSSGNKVSTRDNPNFFSVKGAKVPMRLWFGVPQNYDASVGFNRLIKKMRVALKQGKKVSRVKIGRL
jgi:hypothetical protein